MLLNPYNVRNGICIIIIRRIMRTTQLLKIIIMYIMMMLTIDRVKLNRRHDQSLSCRPFQQRFLEMTQNQTQSCFIRNCWLYCHLRRSTYCSVSGHNNTPWQRSIMSLINQQLISTTETGASSPLRPFSYYNQPFRMFVVFYCWCFFLVVGGGG